METNPATESIFDTEQLAVRASTSQRLVNYIVDVIVFYGIMFLVGVVIALVSPPTIASIADEKQFSGITDRILSVVLYAVYMSIAETIFKGKSIGKFITGTRAVNLDGSRISTGTAWGRGFSRAVPFVVFSAFGNPCEPWQDKWTKTMVIDERKSLNK